MSLRSITIPASTEEIDGSAFVGCSSLKIQVATRNLNFKVEGYLLVTSDGTVIVRYFGRDRAILVGEKVKVLGKSCFEGCHQFERIYFEIGSELERINRSALRGCLSLMWIEIPASVERIEEASFEGCMRLESCSISRNSSLVAIGARAFAKCTSLSSFSIPPRFAEIGNNCFRECIYLYRLKFMSSESLARVVGDRSLDDILEGIGMSVRPSPLRIDMEDGGVELTFTGSSYVGGGDDEGDSEVWAI
jgi:hypothetical protein